MVLWFYDWIRRKLFNKVYFRSPVKRRDKIELEVKMKDFWTKLEKNNDDAGRD